MKYTVHDIYKPSTLFYPLFLFKISSMGPNKRTNVSLSMACTRSAPLAITVACLGLLVSSAISPKNWPFDKVATNVCMAFRL